MDKLKSNSVKIEKKPVTVFDDFHYKNVEVTKYSIDDSKNENTKGFKQLCFEIDAENSKSNEDSEINFEKEVDVSKHEYINIKCMKNDVNVEIDISEAPINKKCVTVEISLEKIRQRLKNLSSQVTVKPNVKTRFYATIDPSKNQQAESELSKLISKDMFSQVSNKISSLKICIIYFL